MILILDWLKERRISDRRSFSASLESKDRGLHYRAVIRYRWWLNPDSPAPRPLAPDEMARYLLREELTRVARTYRLLDRAAAADAMNSVLGQELSDHEQRLWVVGHVRIRVPKPTREAALRRAAEEEVLRSAHARETVELDLLLDRLTDPVLGPVWWVSRYADLQFATGDPKQKVVSVLGAFKELQKTLHAARIDQTSNEKLLVRRKIEEVFNVIEDKESLSLALQVMNRTLDHLGMHRPEVGQVGESGSVRNTQAGPPLA
ncbi:hypothetical protein SNOUR_22610 [Streptomyces noursei ATCC 11455]|uniref:hypothetical protein n=1 Tax=Streptomyces noursei TaxID=1971 RepID=UPI00081CF888|nr:hypothetical protein SNOUR_22610 [Streptomyces noursei ATCC 11455]